MDNPQLNSDVAVAGASHDVTAREDHLERRLSPRQVSMIALGGAIGTGFFLGSGVSVRLAGPGVILAYLFAGFIALVIALALAGLALVGISTWFIPGMRSTLLAGLPGCGL